MAGHHQKEYLQVELLIFVIALCALAFLATRFGYDSRASAWSKEAEISSRGVTWELHGLPPGDLDSAETVNLQIPGPAEPARQEFSQRAKELAGTVHPD